MSFCPDINNTRNSSKYVAYSLYVNYCFEVRDPNPLYLIFFLHYYIIFLAQNVNFIKNFDNSLFTILSLYN